MAISAIEARSRVFRPHLAGQGRTTRRSGLAPVLAGDGRYGLAVGLTCAVTSAVAKVTAMGRSAVADAAGSMHGFPGALTSFVGRAQTVTEIADRLAQCRLVTVTGPVAPGRRGWPAR